MSTTAAESTGSPSPRRGRATAAVMLLDESLCAVHGRVLLGGSARDNSVAHFERVFRTGDERALRLQHGLEVRKRQELQEHLGA